MKFIKAIIPFILVIGLTLLGTGLFYAAADNDVPVRMIISYDPEIRLQTDGYVDELVFTIINDSDESYTLHDAHLYDGYDGVDRVLTDTITIDSRSSIEFTLHNIPIKEEQLNQDIVYTLSWYEHVEITVEQPSDQPESGNNENPDDSEDDADIVQDEIIVDDTVSSAEIEIQKIERTINSVVRIDKFVPPVLNLSASVSADAVQYGSTFTITYVISNNTKYDMSAIRLTDLGVSSEQIELPDTNLMAGESMTINKEYVMGEEDVLIHPVITYVAAQRQTETELEETITVTSVIIGIKLEVQQYPSNEEGTAFAITVTNTGNRSLTNIQMYDEINSKIDNPFDLGPQQQKVLTFQVPSAYVSGLIRKVQFHLICKDYFNNTFTFKDVNIYECVPYISSDAVRLSLLAEITRAFYDDNNQLCGTFQFEIRNYSDVRITNASVQESTVLGKITDFSELQRGETFYTASFALDNIDTVSFRLRAYDSAGTMYETDPVILDLSQLESMASQKEVKPVIYHSNAFLKNLIDKFTLSFRNIVFIALILVVIGGIVGIVLWLIEHKIRAKLPRESMLKISAPAAEEKIDNSPSMDQVLSGSPAEQLGYRPPAKMRYGHNNAFKFDAKNSNHNDLKDVSVRPSTRNSSVIKQSASVQEELEELNNSDNSFPSLSIGDIHPSYDISFADPDFDSVPDEAETDKLNDNDVLIDQINDEYEDPFKNVFVDALSIDNGEETNENAGLIAGSDNAPELDSFTEISSSEIQDDYSKSGPRIIEFRPIAANRKLKINTVIHLNANDYLGD